MLRDDCIGLDRNEAARPHVVADVRVLPFADCSFEQLIAADVLEHVLPWEIEPTLAEWRRVMRPRAEMYVRVPNMHRLGRLLQTSSGVELAQTIRNIYGGHRFGPNGEWDTHHVGFTPDLLATALTLAGFVVEHNDAALNMTARARRVD